MNERPDWSERLLEWLLPPSVAEEVVGDLREEWSVDGGRRPASLVRFAAALSIVVRFHAPRISVEALPSDLRLAFRRMWREPGASAVMVGALALGLGVNMVMLSVADAVLLSPLPYPASERLAALSNDHRGSSTGGFGVAYESVRDIRSSVLSIESVGLYLDWQDLTYDDGSRALRMPVAFVSPEYVELLGLETSLGRLFDADESRENAAGAVAILGHGAWGTHFGQDPSVLGRALSLNGQPFQVVGVMADDRGDLRYLWGQDPVQLYLPLFAAEELLGLELDGDRGTRYLSAIARIGESSGLDAARADLRALSRRLDADYPETNEGWTFHLEDLHEDMFSELRAPVTAILWISLLVLLLVVVNLATLTVLRTTARLRDVAVRQALGAAGAGVIARSVAESALVAGLALAIAVAGAEWALSVLSTASAVRLPSFSSIDLRGSVVWVGAAVSVALAALLGLLQAVVLLRQGGVQLLGSASRGTTPFGTDRLRSGLVATQVAVAVVLLTGAGLLLKSHSVLRATDIGFEAERLLLAQVDLRAQEMESDELLDFARGVVSEAESLPWVERAFTWGPNPLGHGNRVAIAAPEGRWATNPEQRFEASRHSVMPQALTHLGIELLSGRDFSPEDAADVPLVTIVSESMARTLWPGDRAVGQRLELMVEGRQSIAEVVGVVNDARHRTRLVDPFGAQRDIYFPLPQMPTGLLTIAVRYGVGADLESIATGLRRIVRERSAAVPLHGVTTMTEQMRREEGPSRVAAGIMAVYGSLGVALAAMGLFGVLAHSVRLRMREIGIRKALGAERGRVVWWVVRRGMLLTAIGIGVGAVATVPAARLIEAALYGVEPATPSVVLTVWIGLLLVGFASCWLPARLAASVPPGDVLRSD